MIVAQNPWNQYGAGRILWTMEWGLPLSQYRVLVESAPVMVWRAGVDTRCDYFNETWLAFTGRTLAQELGDGWAEGVHPDDLPRCLAAYHGAFNARLPFELEYRLRRHDGAYRYIFDRGVPFTDDAGRFAGYIGSCVDVHDRRMAERDRAVFLGLFAHEMRTPLTSLGALVERARRLTSRAETVDEATLAKLDLQLERIGGLVLQLADTARIEEGRPLDLTRAPLDVAELVRREGARFAGWLASRPSVGHRLTLDVAPGVLPIRGDAARLSEVVRELLENAVKFSPRGGAVELSAARVAGQAVVRVRDEGIGIPAADLPHVGRRFFRASNATPSSYGGLGLGLALAREVVETHGGQLEVASAPPGTQVRVVLPLVGAEA